MNPHLFVPYLLAVAVLALIPGRVVTLVIANSLSHGSQSGLATVAGASIGNTILLCATAVGLVAFFVLLSEIFQIVRWASPLYLVWLGIKPWRTYDGHGGASMTAAKRPSHTAFLQGFLIPAISGLRGVRPGLRAASSELLAPL